MKFSRDRGEAGGANSSKRFLGVEMN